SATEVWPVSKVTLAVCATGLASTRATPGHWPSTCSGTAFSEAQFRPPTCKTVVTVFPGVRPVWDVILPPSHSAACRLAGRAGAWALGRVEGGRAVRGAEPGGLRAGDPAFGAVAGSTAIPHTGSVTTVPR